MASLQRVLRPAGGSRRILAGIHRATTTVPAPPGCCAAARRTNSSSSPAGKPPSTAPDAIPDGELGVGELRGASFRVEPLRRVGEDVKTLRARLLRTCQDSPPNEIRKKEKLTPTHPFTPQANPAAAEPSNQNSSSRPLQRPTCHP